MNTELDNTTVSQMAGRSNRRKGKCMADVFLWHDLASLYQQDGGLSFLSGRDKEPQNDDAAFIFRYAALKFADIHFSTEQRRNFYKLVITSKNQKAEIESLTASDLR